MFDYMIGISLGCIFISRDSINNNDRVYTIFEIFSLILLVFVFSRINISLKFRYAVYWVPINCSIIYIFARNKGLISKILNKKIFIYLGEISFYFYLIHYAIIKYFNFFINKILKVELNNLIITLEFLIVFAISLILAMILYKYLRILNFKEKNIENIS